MSARTSIPRKVRDEVLREYNHLCAICAEPNPHLHHIDGDNSNHDPLNLLPLCPNHHLNDQHDPTRSIEPQRLRLFRRFKDPAILSPQFEPLYRRLAFLDDLSAEWTDFDALEAQAEELVDFLRVLRMGDFYSVRIGELLAPPDPYPFVSADVSHAELDQRHRERHALYLEQLRAGREDVLSLSVELLRYQDWLPANGI